LSFTNAELLVLVDRVCQAVIDHADELTALDRAIGDADHGLNMERGFRAVQSQLEKWRDLAPGAVISEAGKTLVMTIGGASGPLYGTLFMRLGQEFSRVPVATQADLVAALRVAIDAVKARGKSQVGQKTLLDVLEPVHAHLAQSTGASWRELEAVADEAAKGTIALKAERGRASFLGERSRGHMDPGARSCAVIVAAAVQSLAGPLPLGSTEDNAKEGLR
jgi:dihydroxyacetone kinase-like protein